MSSGVNEWIQNIKSDVYFVHIVDVDQVKDSVNHIVVADGAAKKVQDPCERYLLELKRDVFSACLGDEVRFNEFKEVHCIVFQPKRKRNRYPKKSREKRRKLRTKKRLPKTSGSKLQ